MDNTARHILSISALSYSYKNRRALDSVSFSVEKGTVFGVLGPNGSGKSTLFKIISTLLPHQEGEIKMFGNNLSTHRVEIRKKIGVVFQSPSIDRRLTVQENLLIHGALYRMRRVDLFKKINEVLALLILTDRRNELCESLSGGMKRKVELAKCLLHDPALLILDEPSTGLDLRARKSFTTLLKNLCSDFGVTILLTTHFLEDADECQNLIILDNGKIVAEGNPHELKSGMGGDIISVVSTNAHSLNERIENAFHIRASIIQDVIHFEHTNGAEFIPEFVQHFANEIESISLRKPTLEDVFIRVTGHSFSPQDNFVQTKTSSVD